MRLVIYRTRGLRGTGYRWRLVANNGRKLANGGQGYSAYRDLVRGIELSLGGRLATGYLKRRTADGLDPQLIPVEDRTR